MKTHPFFALALLLLTLTVVAQQTENFELRALPASPNIVVDGDLADWDLSGEILVCPDLGKELDTHAVRAAAAYDDKYLYFAFRWVDQTPMINNINPAADPGGGWRSDGVEMRMIVDNRSIHIHPWYYTEGKRESVHIRYSPAENIRLQKDKWIFIPEALDKGALLRFHKHADGKGYDQEMAIPWNLLTIDARVLTAGDTMKLGLQVNWGDDSGGLLTGGPVRRYQDIVNPENPMRRFFWEAVNAWGNLRFLDHGNVPPSPSIKQASLAGRLEAKLYTTAGPVAISYKLPVDGFVTLVVEKPDGTRVRNLVGDYPRAAGPNVDRWDGTDDDGRLVAPGEYRVRGLFHEALDVKYQFNFGTPGPTPWVTADGRGAWLSNHCNHTAILADGERVYVAAPECEGVYPLIALNAEGNKVWGALPRWHAGPMARVGDHLYTVNEKEAIPPRRLGEEDDESPIELVRLDAATGREVPFADGNSRHRIATWVPLEDGVGKKWEGWTVEHAAHNADWVGLNAQGMAAVGNRLYVSLHYQDKLLVIDAGTGWVTGEIALPDPAGLATVGDALLAISGTQVVRVDPATGTATPVVTTNLSAPVGLAVDKRGRIYVSDWADQMCVKVFSPRGELVRTIGKPGGRPWVGPYDASGMLMPLGISVDPQGRLWVAENDFSPRRVSCWDTRTGEVVLERLGRGRYGGMGYYVLPDNPKQGIYMNCLVDLDWETGRWRAASTLWRGTKENEVVGFDPYTRFGRVIHRDGRRLLVHTSKLPQRGVVVISELTADGRAKPLAAMGPVSVALARPDQRYQGGLEPPPLLADHLWTEPALNAAARKVIPWWFEGPCAGSISTPRFASGEILRRAARNGWKRPPGVQAVSPNNNFVWSDLDGDGGIDDDEIRYHTTPGMDDVPLPPAWNPEAWSGGVVDDDFNVYLSVINDGQARHYRLPVSRWTDSGVPVYDPDQAECFVTSPLMGEAAWVSPEGNLLTLANIPGAGRPNRQRDPLVMYRPDGSIAWTFPSPWTGVHGSHTAPRAKRGQLVGPLGVFGTAEIEGAGRIFAFHTNQGTAEFFTDDGLYVGRLFQDTRVVPEPWPAAPQRGQSLNKMTNGGEWFGGQFFQAPDGRNYVICSRDGGVVAEVTGLDTVRRIEAQPLRFDANEYAQAQELIAANPPDAEEARVMRVAPWTAGTSVPPPLNAFRWSDAAVWRYDQTRGARATWSTDGEYLYVAFQVEDDTPMINSGEDVRRLFKFGDAAVLELRTAPEQTAKQVVPGDLRLLFSVHQGKPVAVLYDYRRPGKGEPVELSSVKTTRIERLEVLADAAIAVDRDADGYALRAAVPLKDLQWQPEPGKAYPGDFGIVYSDRTGQTNMLRMYWSNRATGIVSDLSLEADIQPANWGTFEVPE